MPPFTIGTSTDFPVRLSVIVTDSSATFSLQSVVYCPRRGPNPGSSARAGAPAPLAAVVIVPAGAPTPAPRQERGPLPRSPPSLLSPPGPQPRLLGKSVGPFPAR